MAIGYTPQKWTDTTTSGGPLPFDGARSAVRRLLNVGWTESDKSSALFFARLDNPPLSLHIFKPYPHAREYRVLVTGGNRAARRAALDTMKGGA